MAGDGPGAARLLVVEDDETILELLSGSLRFAGFDVVTAASGAEALRAAAASKPDLVLLDVMMPDGDGFGVVRQLRSSGPHLPVIFLTARDGVHERVAGLALGADDYVTKPFSLDEVVERIRAVLRRAGRPAAATRLRVADLELDEESHEVRREGALIALTPTEFRLLQFLMLNAQHTPPQSPVTVSVTSTTGTGEIIVADNGPGMTAEQAAHIFERFYRTDGARSRGRGGTGLGLSIAASLAAAHGGDITVDTKPGQGAAFHVRLPLTGAGDR